MERERITSTASEFGVGSVLSRTFSTLFANPVLFFGLALISMLPSTFLDAMSDEGERNALLTLLNGILAMLISGAFSYAVFQFLRGNKATIGESFSRGMNRLLPLIGVAILSGLGILLGIVLFVIPGIILICMWVVDVPACVVERLGPIESMKRSAALTKGYRLKIFGLLLIANIVPQFIVYILAALLSPLFMGSRMIMVIVLSLILTIPQAFNAVLIAIMYYDLRAVKEGVTIESLANVFD